MTKVRLRVKKLAEPRTNLGKRKQTMRRLYPPNWNALRIQAMRRDKGLCVSCRDKGINTVAEECHHIVPVRFGGKNELENLRMLCRPCHFGMRRDRIRTAWSNKRCIHKKRYLLARKKKGAAPLMQIPLCEEQICIRKIPNFLLIFREDNSSKHTAGKVETEWATD